MSAKSMGGRASWGRPGAVIAPLILISLIGLGLVGSARAGEAPASVFGAQIRVRPTSGPAGTVVTVRGSGFLTGGEGGCGGIPITFTDAVGTSTLVGFVGTTDTFEKTVTIPAGAAIGAGTISASEMRLFNPHHPQCVLPGPRASAPYTVTGLMQRALRASGIRVDRSGLDVRSIPSATIAVRPRFGPGGTTITVRGSGFSPLYCSIYLSFTDAVGTVTTLDTLGPMSSFMIEELIPPDAAIGAGTVRAHQNTYNPALHRCSYLGGPTGTATFTVTGLSGN